MKEIQIEQMVGHQVRGKIDAFYKKNGSSGRARDDDRFFIALIDGEVVGCVRFCIEENTPMLRTMYVDSTFRKRGIGLRLLQAFAQYLDENHIQNVYCLPYTHLDRFYGQINFQIVQDDEVPLFLKIRSGEYAKKGTNTLFMRRR